MKLYRCRCDPLATHARPTLAAREHARGVSATPVVNLGHGVAVLAELCPPHGVELTGGCRRR
jgi:hypothetical protein